MKFEWNPAKSQATLARRGFDFEFATGIFRNRTVDGVDQRFDYGEVRVRSIGQTKNMFLVVIHTVRGEKTRIISARIANKKERELWQTSSQ